MATKKRLLNEAEIAEEIRFNEKRWFVDGLSQTAVKKLLREKHNCRINRDVFAETMVTVGKYYPVLKKKPRSLNVTLFDHQWETLKIAVNSLRSELQGLTLKQGYELIRTRVRTNHTQLTGLPSRLHFWNQG